MGQIREPRPVLLLLAAFSRYPTALDWARGRAESSFGPVALVSRPFDFSQTDFYEADMGSGLVKQFFAFERLWDAALLADIKHDTNRWEDEFAQQSHHAESRPLNLDPGYMSEAKLVLASTKDRDHRIYLRRGIYAEGTLYYHKRRWERRSWTYPDYQSEAYHMFFSECRTYLRSRYRAGDADGPNPGERSP